MMYRNLLKAGWVVCCFGVLGWWLYVYAIADQVSHQLKAETVLLLSFWMTALSFPLGLLWFVSLGPIYYIAELAGLNLTGASIWEVIGLWLGFVAIGYFQWFKLFPWILGKWRVYRERIKN